MIIITNETPPKHTLEWIKRKDFCEKDRSKMGQSLETIFTAILNNQALIMGLLEKSLNGSPLNKEDSKLVSELAIFTNLTAQSVLSHGIKTNPLNFNVSNN
jgi:hypothetical protein